MRWVLIGLVAIAAGCGAILAPEPRADEGLEFLGDTTPRAEERMLEIESEERAATDLEDTYGNLERKYDH
jgi:hypothetical protein